MLRVLLLCLTLLPSLVMGGSWSGYVYAEDDSLVGSAYFQEEPERVFGGFRLFNDPRYDFVSFTRTAKNIYEGRYFLYGSLNVWTPASGQYAVLGGRQYWTFAIENRTYHAVLTTDD